MLMGMYILVWAMGVLQVYCACLLVCYAVCKDFFFLSLFLDMDGREFGVEVLVRSGETRVEMDRGYIYRWRIYF